MGLLRFDWDERDNAANRRRHGVSFEDARTAFLDDKARVIPDPEHPEAEYRFVLIGLSTSLRALAVCHCHRQTEEVFRIISARRADQNETRQYQWWLK